MKMSNYQLVMKREQMRNEGFTAGFSAVQSFVGFCGIHEHAFQLSHIPQDLPVLWCRGIQQVMIKAALMPAGFYLAIPQCMCVTLSLKRLLSYSIRLPLAAIYQGSLHKVEYHLLAVLFQGLAMPLLFFFYQPDLDGQNTSPLYGVEKLPLHPSFQEIIA
jgi:hypothetical protein